MDRLRQKAQRRQHAVEERVSKKDIRHQHENVFAGQLCPRGHAWGQPLVLRGRCWRGGGGPGALADRDDGEDVPPAAWRAAVPDFRLGRLAQLRGDDGGQLPARGGLGRPAGPVERPRARLRAAAPVSWDRGHVPEGVGRFEEASGRRGGCRGGPHRRGDRHERRAWDRDGTNVRRGERPAPL